VVSASEMPRERLEVMVVPGVPQSVGSVRRSVRDLLGPDHPALDGVLVCLSEVVTNAIRHTASGRDGQIRIEAALGASEIRIGTLDQGGAATEPRMVTAKDEGGRGLTLVDALADDWGAERQGDATLVWFTVKC
jgi:anti-sigma regulatory factor (Ser/Thr protein kinase)